MLDGQPMVEKKVGRPTVEKKQTRSDAWDRPVIQ
jgi:hypothetical protein